MYKAMVAGWVAGLVAGWLAGRPKPPPPPPPAGWRSSFDAAVHLCFNFIESSMEFPFNSLYLSLQCLNTFNCR